MPEIHQARRRRAQDMVRELDADAVLVTSAPNVRYLTGLASSNAALLLPADGQGVLATDFRYALAARRDAPDLELIIDRILDLHARGKSILLIEHNMEMVSRLCGRVVVMATGSYLTEGAPAEVARNPAVIDAYLGGAA